MNQEKEKYQLRNWELVSINPNNRNWYWSDYFNYWAVATQSIIGLIIIIIFPKIVLWLPNVLYGQ